MWSNMQRLIKDQRLIKNECARRKRFGRALALAAVTLVMLALTACGGSSSSAPQQNAMVAGNWQFTMTPPGDGSFTGGLQGGFLLESNGTLTGQAVYSVSNTQNGQTVLCNSGSAPISGTLSGQTLTLTVVAGSPSNNITFALTGTVSSTSNGPVINTAATYSTTVVTPTGETPCGTAQTGLAWSAFSVPPLSGTVQGTFHSTGGVFGLANQDFALVSGTISQGENIGASNATVTGNLTFQDPVTLLSDYPCFPLASITGTISGTSVMLQLMDTNGTTVGQIGEPAGAQFSGASGLNPVTYVSAQGGNILQGAGPSYLVASKGCGGSLSDTTVAGDFGNVCLSVGGGSACQQPLTITPAFLTFPSTLLGAVSANSQTVTVTNNTSAPLNGLTLSFANNQSTSSPFGGYTDFDGLPSFTEQDTCASPLGTTFSLTAGQSCVVTVTFTPQEGCPWLPFGNPPLITGAAPEWCPLPQSAQVTVQTQSSPDGDKLFTVVATGIGLSSLQPSVPELDFGAEEQLSPPETSVPQAVSFTNVGANPVQILGAAPCVNTYRNGNAVAIFLKRPLSESSAVAGLQVVANYQGLTSIAADAGTVPPTITYSCDSDPSTSLPNFQISEDTCTGSLLAPQASCSIQVTYLPQPKTNIGSGGLDAFIELNTVECTGSVTTNCEIDSGRFPVELKSNGPSPLRMLPAAGLDFGTQTAGKTSAPLTITLLNDPNLATTQTVTFVGKITVSGNYAESDDCTASLSPGASCTLTVTFKPGTVGFIPGTLTINYTQQSSSGPVTTGNPQIVKLLGTGQ